MTDTNLYISVFSGLMLIVSEILPYVSNVKGNGIVQIILNSCSKYDEDKKKEHQTLQDLIKKVDDLSNRMDRLIPRDNSQIN